MMTDRSEQGPWRPNPDAYAYTRMLSTSGWAWEFLRRNSQFRREALKHRRRDRPERRNTIIPCPQDDGTMWLIGLQRVNVAERWGLELFPDPDKNGLETTPFWLPDVIGGDIEALMEPPARIGCDLFSISSVPKRKTVLIRLGERVRMTVDGSGFNETIGCAAPSAPPSGEILVALTVGGERKFRTHVDRLGAFLDYCQASAPGAPRMAENASRRLREILIALDGRRSGRSYREIACAFYEPDQVKDDWATNAAMKQRIRRLVLRGDSLMRSCYRRLVAPRAAAAS